MNHFQTNLIIFCIGLACAVFGYLWSKNDDNLSAILIKTTEVSTQIASNRAEWELREGRILNALEKQSITIDRLLEITNRHNAQIVLMEQRLSALEDLIKK